MAPNASDDKRHNNLSEMLRFLHADATAVDSESREQSADSVGPLAWTLYRDLAQCGIAPPLDGKPKGAGPEDLGYWDDLEVVGRFVQKLNQMFPVEGENEP